MSSKKKHIVLIGGGGHCKSCIEAIESTGDYCIEGILDLPSRIGETICDYRLIGTDADIKSLHEEGFCFLITVGQIKSPDLRKDIFKHLTEIGARLETVIASTAFVSRHSTIGKGTVVMHGAVVNAGVHVGDNCIINTGAILEHDVKVGNHTHISTQSVVNGNSTIGSETFIGSASCITNGLSIPDRVVIGAGALVLKDIFRAGTYTGSPVKILNE